MSRIGPVNSELVFQKFDVDVDEKGRLDRKMAGRKSSRNCCRGGKQDIVQKPERNSAILSPHDELRERLLETALDVKENIPEQGGGSRRSGSLSDCSESRKRRSTKDGPAAKRPSNEKNRSTSGDDSVDFPSDDRDIGSSSSGSQSSRTRGQPLPAMPEEDEVFDKSDEEEDVLNVVDEEDEEFDDEELGDEGGDDDEEEEDGVRGTNTLRRRDETDDEDQSTAPIQSAEFEFTKKHMNSSQLIPAPPLLSAAKCEGIGSPTKVWSLMVKRDDIPRATNCLLQNHPEMTVGMRRMLVDWMMEVCESEKLHRETFHLAVDYVDRYLETAGVRCSQDTFQLVGTAALFIAAKYEEIYPPKCADFAGLTDGAFTADNIREMEVILAREIGWSLGPITSIQWLSTYLQLLGTENRKTQSDHCDEGNMYVPELLRSEYVEMCKILDYCLFEIDSFKYSYRTLAAAVLFVTYEPRIAVEQATGFTYEQLLQVIRYVKPICSAFARMRQDGEVIPAHSHVKSDDSHNIQVHIQFIPTEKLVSRERERLVRMRQRVAAGGKMYS